MRERPHFDPSRLRDSNPLEQAVEKLDWEDDMVAEIYCKANDLELGVAARIMYGFTREEVAQHMEISKSYVTYLRQSLAKKLIKND